MDKLAIDASTAAQWQLSEEPEAERARSMLRDYAAAKWLCHAGPLALCGRQPCKQSGRDTTTH